MISSSNPLSASADYASGMENFAGQLAQTPTNDRFQDLLERATAKMDAKAENPNQAKGDLNDAANQMETMLVTFMLKTMDKYGTENGLLGKTAQGMGYFKDLFFQNMAERMVSDHGLGFKEALQTTYGIK